MIPIRVGEHAAELWKVTDWTVGREKIAEQRIAAIIRRGQCRRRRAGVHLFPVIGEVIAIQITGRPGQNKRRVGRNGVVAASINPRRIVAGGGDYGTATAGAGQEGLNLIQTASMEEWVAVSLKVVRGTNAGIAHDGQPAARLEGGRGIPIAVA